MLKLRTPDIHDRAELLAMGKAMHAESPRYRDRKFNEIKALCTIDYFIGGDGAFLAEDNGEIIGMMCGVKCAMMFTDDNYVTDLITYIKPKARGGMAIVMLIKAFEAWAFADNVEEVLLGISCNPETMGKIKNLYAKLGYSPATCAMMKTKEQYHV